MDSDPKRMTLSVPPRTEEALQRLMARTALNRTDVVHRAIRLLDLFEEEVEAGGNWAVRRPDGSYEHVRLI